MASESKRLVRLVNDLLALARTEARRPLSNDLVRLKPIVEEVIRQTRLLDPDRPICCDPLLDVTVLGEVDSLKQILLILADNAVKYTDGPIAVSTEVSSGQVAVRIQDSGPGIDPTLLPHLFQRFSRGHLVEGSLSAEADRGAGLGLSIAKALTEAQGGTIAVQSQVGQGTCFTVTLPLAAAMVQA
jgi:two-component system OmpR family sensor kinase